MRVKCEKCERVYDDAARWTICPHRHLDESPLTEEERMNQENQFEPKPKRHPAVEGVLQFFTYKHLPEHLQAVSQPFAELAEKISDGPQNAETTVALRKLLEAKDCAVRAVLSK